MIELFISVRREKRREVEKETDEVEVWRKAREKRKTHEEVCLDGKRASHRLGGRQGKVDISCDLVFVNSD